MRGKSDGWDGERDMGIPDRFRFRAEICPGMMTTLAEGCELREPYLYRIDDKNCDKLRNRKIFTTFFLVYRYKCYLIIEPYCT